MQYELKFSLLKDCQCFDIRIDGKDFGDNKNISVEQGIHLVHMDIELSKKAVSQKPVSNISKIFPFKAYKSENRFMDLISWDNYINRLSVEFEIDVDSDISLSVDLVQKSCGNYLRTGDHYNEVEILVENSVKEINPQVVVPFSDSKIRKAYLRRNFSGLLIQMLFRVLIITILFGLVVVKKGVILELLSLYLCVIAIFIGMFVFKKICLDRYVFDGLG